ncbi:hypothetical protein K488DRAFT_62297 [Vararia minispora EC-137]|uniref:Uncharacterized protein n=1 Tax=Vararia minispora EC-137 TaxID=1314806 RepID=A0ACB8Q735_9AGAM|nr:hypothetical protein K488DRAFT_62297 [Vararia minispora EC-137]
MSSLRTRKSTALGSISRSSRGTKQQQQQPAKLSKSNKDARKSRVDDKIKKRLSMRYADISAPTDVSGVPSVPTIPTALRPGRAQGRGDVAEPTKPTKEQLKEAENKLLDADNFDPDAYLKIKLANSTEAELKTLQSSLQTSKDDVAVDLQRNVFKNYAQFVEISKEISTLENEMLELKESLAEWKSMPGVLHIDESSSAADRRRNVRSSIADLRVLYANQMQALHSQVEGSAKFVPTTPGRHVVSEMDNIAELNAATYKPINTVRFVILDDAVLVARKRRRRNANESDKLVADRCWTLNEMLVLDTKDSTALVNVFKIRQGKETHVYRTETSGEKRALLVQLRSVAEEFYAKKRREREGEYERRKTIFSNGDRTGDDWMVDLAAQAGMSDGAKEKAERDTQWIGDFTDELAVAIALREWEKAAGLVEEGEAKVANMPQLSIKLTPLTASLTASLLQALSSPNNMKAMVVRLIHLLIRLRAGPAARTTFLSARAETIKRLVRMIRFEGQIGMYVNDLAVVIFTAIKHTADWYLTSFKENEDASAYIEWARQQMESFAAIFRKQVYSSDVEQKTIDEAYNITYLQHRRLLQEYGIDFRFLLDDLLLEHPKEKPVPPPIVQPIFDRPKFSASLSSSASSSNLRSPRSIPTTSSAPVSRSRTPVNYTAAPAVSVVPPMPPLPPSGPSRPTTPSARPTTPSSTAYPSTASARPTTPSARSRPGSPTSPRISNTTSVSPTPMRTAAPVPIRPGAPTPTLSESLRSRASPAPPPRSRDRPSSNAGARPLLSSRASRAGESVGSTGGYF